MPTFTPPGPAFNTKNLAGKKIFVMPTASQLPVCNQIANDIVSLASKFGMTGTNFQNDGGASSWIPGLNQAISQHYSAIVLVCGIDPNLIKPQLAAAKAAGIAVIDSGLGDTGAPQGPNAMSPLVTAQTNIPNIPAMNASVDKGLLDNANGKPFDIFLITSNDVPDGVLMDNALEANIAKYCPSCKIKTDNIPVPDWATQVQSAVSSAVLADPNLKMVITTFDGEDPPALAGLKAAHRSDVKIYGNYGGTPAYINQMGQGVAMGDDVGPSHLWRAYATMDQVLRLLAGVPAVLPSKDEDPSRLFTPQNYSQVNGVNDGFGTSFVTGYDKIWGIS